VYVLSQDTAVVSTVSASGMTLTGLGSASVAPLPKDGNAVDFYLLSSQNNGIYDILYYLDETNATSGAIYKYSLQANQVVWAPNGSWPTADGGDGFCAATNGAGGAYLYYTTGAGGTANNSLVALNDAAGWNANINITATNTLFTAGLTSTLKGLAFAPVRIPAAPTVTMLSPLNVTAGGATLYALVNPNGVTTTNVFFCNTNLTAPGVYYSVGTILLPAGQNPVGVSNLVSGLAPGQIYHFYLNAGNQAGLYDGSGAAASFTTLTVTPPRVGGAKLENSVFSFTFTNTPGASFSVLATNNLRAPVATWPVVGRALESPAGSGSYQYSSPPVTNTTLYYRLRQP
jgi:hypothetical protein